MKGFDEPAASWLVRRERPRSQRGAGRGIDGVATRMVGRDAELEALHAAYAAIARPGAALERRLVVADAGLGKSRLLAEFQRALAARGDAAVVWSARATPASRVQPQSLLRELFVARLAIADDDPPAQARQRFEAAMRPLLETADGSDFGERSDGATAGDDEATAALHVLGQIVGLDYASSPHVAHIAGDARQIRQRGFDAALLALRAVGRRHGAPLVLLLDDLHWADDASLDFVDHVAASPAGAGDAPLLIVGGARASLFDHRPAAADWPRIDLAPLSRRASRGFADEVLRRLPAVPESLRSLVVDDAGGVPFHIEERVQMLIDCGAIAVGTTRWRLDERRLQSLQLPSTLVGVIQARLDALPPAERRALQVASVVGVNVDAGTLAHADAAAAAELPALVRRGLLVARGRGGSAAAARGHAFAHPILHQVTYDTLLRRERGPLHARVAAWLQRQAATGAKALLATAAEHHEYAGDAATAAACYADAADHHASTFAHETALRCCARALALAAPEAVALRFRALARRERTLELLGRRDGQAADLDALGALAASMPDGVDGDRCRGEAAWRRADYAMRSGDHAAQLHHARDALAIAERLGDVDLAMRATMRLCSAMAYSGQAAAAVARIQAAYERAVGLGLVAMQMQLSGTMAICAQCAGDEVAAIGHNARMLELSRALGDRRLEGIASRNAGIGYLRFGRYDDAERCLERAARLTRSLGHREMEATSSTLLALLAMRRGDARRVLVHGRAALEVLVTVAARPQQLTAMLAVAEAEHRLGETAAAAARFAAAEALARDIGMRRMLIDAAEAQARLAFDDGDVDAARQHVERLLTATDSPCGVPTDAALAGADGYAVRWTLYRIWQAAGDARADRVLADAHAALLAEAAAVTDPALRDGLLTGVATHRAIADEWSRRQATSAPN